MDPLLNEEILFLKKTYIVVIFP